MTSIVNYQSNKVSGREVPIHQCNDPLKIAKFLMDNKVINSKIDCKNCDKRPMLLKTRKGHHEPWWRCTKCTSWKSIRTCRNQKARRNK